MDLWHTFDEQGGGEGSQEFGLEGDPYPDALGMDGSQIIPSAGMQATAEFAPHEANGNTAEAEGEADAILQTALDAHRPAAQPQLWPGPPGMVPVEPPRGTGDTHMGEAGRSGASSSEDEQSLAERASREQQSSESGSEDGIEDDEGDDEDMSESDDPERPPRAASAKPKRTSQGRRTRRNILPRIMRGERCGTCHTCLNPQMKKACLTMRQRQMDELSKKGNLPVSMLAKLSPNGGLPPARSKPPAPARKAQKKSPDAAPGRSAAAPKILDLFTQEIKAITSRNGGVEPRHLDTLQRMFRREEQLERRLVLMTILKQSPPETLRGAVAGQKVVAELQKWLQSAVESKEYRLAFRVIETLDRLPIDLATFQSTGVGKTMAQLARKGPEEVKKSAGQLVARWKESMKAVAPSDSDASKRPRDAKGTAEEGAAKKLKVGPGSKKGSSTLPRQNSGDSRESSRAALTPVDDDAMFQRRDKKPAMASLQDSVSQMKKTHQIKVLNEEAARKLKAQERKGEPGAKPDGSGGGPPSSAEGATPPAAKDEPGEDPTKPGKRPLLSNLGGGAPISAPLGSSRITGIGTGITRIGGQGSSLAPLSVTIEPPLDAAARAAAAAAKVPEPPPVAPRTKAKKVSWRGDDTLVLVRWFLQADPAIAVKEDARETTELDSGAPATMEEDHPPGFVSAAKREHQNEAAALRMHRLKEEEQQPGAPKLGEGSRPGPPPHHPQAALYHPMVDWPTRFGGPPRAVNREREYGQPSDEQRFGTPATVMLTHALEGMPEARYPNPIMIPTSPLEPPPDPTPYAPPVRLLLEAPPPGANPAAAPPVLQPQQVLHPVPGPPQLAPLQGFLGGSNASTGSPSFPQQQQHPPFSGPRPAMGMPGPPPRARPLAPPGIRPQQPPQSADGGPGGDGGRGRGGRGPGRGAASGWGRWQGRGRGPERAPANLGTQPMGRGRGRGGRSDTTQIQGRGSGDPARQSRVPCAFYGTPQGCKNGDQCPFLHGDRTTARR